METPPLPANSGMLLHTNASNEATPPRAATRRHFGERVHVFFPTVRLFRIFSIDQKWRNERTFAKNKPRQKMASDIYWGRRRPRQGIFFFGAFRFVGRIIYVLGIVAERCRGFRRKRCLAVRYGLIHRPSICFPIPVPILIKKYDITKHKIKRAKKKT